MDAFDTVAPARYTELRGSGCPKVTDDGRWFSIYLVVLNSTTTFR